MAMDVAVKIADQLDVKLLDATDRKNKFYVNLEDPSQQVGRKTYRKCRSIIERLLKRKTYYSGLNLGHYGMGLLQRCVLPFPFFYLYIAFYEVTFAPQYLCVTEIRLTSYPCL